MINKEMLETLLLYHNENNRELIRKQAEFVDDFIAKNRLKYDSLSGYREAMDEILKLVLQGELVGDNDEN